MTSWHENIFLIMDPLCGFPHSGCETWYLFISLQLAWLSLSIIAALPAILEVVTWRPCDGIILGYGNSKRHMVLQQKNKWNIELNQGYVDGMPSYIIISGKSTSLSLAIEMLFVISRWNCDPVYYRHRRFSVTPYGVTRPLYVGRSKTVANSNIKFE